MLKRVNRKVVLKMTKGVILILGGVGLLLLLVAFGVSVQAQSANDIQDSLNSGIDKANAIKDTAEGFTEQDRAAFLAQKWKETLLMNPVIKGIDGVLKKMNWAFIILFGRSYALSIELFFSMLLWSLAFAFVHYLFHFEKDWLNWVLGIAISTGLAQLQIFNYLSSVAGKFVLEASGTWWVLARTAVIIIAVVFLFVLNKYFGKEIAAMRKAKKLHELENKVEMQETRNKKVDRALDEAENMS